MTEPIRPGDNPNELLVFDHGFVRLDDAMATDLSVVNSARVSFAVKKEVMEDEDTGLIKFLMRDRHGCYDDSTDVLTDQGWKSWPEVTGEELFATRSPSGELEYEPALAVVHKEYSGAMVGFKGLSVDMMVTPDHNVLAAQTTRDHSAGTQPSVCDPLTRFSGALTGTSQQLTGRAVVFPP